MAWVVNHKLMLQCTDCNYDGREENDTFFGVSAAFLFLCRSLAYLATLSVV